MAKEHLQELKDKGSRVEISGKNKMDDVDELDFCTYVVRERRRLADGTEAVRAKYWWEVVIVPLETNEG